MTPKEKALDLFVSFYERYPDSSYSNGAAKNEAKWCALRCVNEIIYESQNYLDSSCRWMRTSDRVYQTNEQRNEYWFEVKEEISKI